MDGSIKAVVASSALLILVAAPAAGGPRERTESVHYEVTSGMQVGDTLTLQVGQLPQARPAARERTVSIVLEDDSGRPVAGAVHQGDHELADICGATDAPVRFVTREPVHVHILTGPGCSDVSVPTQGTVTFTFSR